MLTSLFGLHLGGDPILSFNPLVLEAFLDFCLYLYKYILFTSISSNLPHESSFKKKSIG